MSRKTHQLNYSKDAGVRENDRLRSSIALLFVAIVIYGLRKLETMPYRPPQDMSSFLGGEELRWVRAIMILFAILGVVLLFRFIGTFRREGNE